jgi:hypothetical protein
VLYPGRIDKTKINNLKNDINSATKVQDLINSIEKGLELFNI